MTRTPDEERNVEIVERMFTDPTFHFLGAFADDATWWNGLPIIPGFEGTTEFKGIDAIQRLMSSAGRKLGPGMDVKDVSTIVYEDVVVLADGDFVVRQHTERCRTERGQQYRNVYCYVFRFDRGGRIAYVTEHWNTWYTYRTLFHQFDVEPAHPLAEY